MKKTITFLGGAMKGLSSLGMLFGRWCIAAIFILAGINKFVNYDAAVQYMTSVNMPLVPFFLVAAALLEIITGLMLVFGIKTRIAALLLLLFLIPTTFLFHDFWAKAGESRQVEMIMFLKNIAIFGGLLYILSCGAGGCSCDRFCCKKREKEKESDKPTET